MEWKDTMYDFSNPRKTGPGVWFTFHLNAAQSTTKEERLIVCKQIRNFCVYFKCSDCQSHCKKYVRDYPPENYVETNEMLFKWTVDFRNAVQRRLKGPIYDYAKMQNIFYDSTYMVCEEGCGSDKAGDNKQESSQYIELSVSRSKAQAKVHELFGVPLTRKIGKIGHRDGYHG